MSEIRRPVLCSFESRRASEMASLIERQGGTALIAPSMRELPIEENPVALEAIRRIINGEFPCIVLMTGVGTEALFDVARSAAVYESLLAALQKCTIIVRGPKPVAVLGKVQAGSVPRRLLIPRWRYVVIVLAGLIVPARSVDRRWWRRRRLAVQGIRSAVAVPIQAAPVTWIDIRD